ncbi:MAG: divergent polysaccharide deacetylase family protein [Candidatus Omnitrophica bacterium]|nr:divergent polysaccharide deacetylase family protein [Candidatus Omnitrophota bacterium]MCF7893854.1 divergent polysaccharide deacetylase family protein [Candidatus Omnitrophota bacterium]
MSKNLKIIFLITLIAVLIISYFSRQKASLDKLTPKSPNKNTKIALIFDDLGQSLESLRQIYNLKIPVTVAVIPELKFSKNIAHIAARSGFSVLIHLPLEPKKANYYLTDKYKFISSELSENQIDRLLYNYLNSIRIAIGVNNHMGSKATQNPKLMDQVLERIKQKRLIFIDSQTTPKSVAYKIAKSKGIDTAYNQLFLDAIDDPAEMKKRINDLIDNNKSKKLIIIAHPKKNTFKFLKNNLSQLKKRADFITLKEYFANQ